MTIAITGATGELGQLVLYNLLEKNLEEKIVAVARNKEKAKELFKDTVEIRFGDYFLSDSLLEAFKDIDKLLFISSPNTDDMSRVLEHTTVIKAARDAGVKHIYYTSLAHVEESELGLAKLHIATEAIIKVSGIPYTFLRNPLYTEVFVNSSLNQAIKNGQLVSNTGSGKLNTVPRSDLAKATAEILSSNDFQNSVVELASSTTWTFNELADILSEISGKKVRHLSLNYQEAVDQFVEAGLPKAVAHFSASTYQAIAEGEAAKTETHLKKLIGEEINFKTFVKDSLQ